MKPEPNDEGDGVLRCWPGCSHYQMDCEEYSWPPEICIPAVREMAAELERLRAALQKCNTADAMYALELHARSPSVNIA